MGRGELGKWGSGERGMGGRGEVGKWGIGEMGMWGSGEVGKLGSGEMGMWGSCLITLSPQNPITLSPYLLLPPDCCPLPSR
ncbi:MAG: isopentenyl pyrophosphate isomerase [Microcystis sp. M015S1]|nr:isopentenyl pyrophosphate isomerase [Microcystis sp. M015S1]